MGQVLDDLIAVRARIDTPAKWTKHCLFRNEVGDYIPSQFDHLGEKSPVEAASMCFNGAKIACGLYRRDHKQRSADVDRVMLKANPLIEGQFRRYQFSTDHHNSILIDWNNSPFTDHPALMEAFDKAIAYAKARDL